jgi:hypothetical protein
MLPIYNLLSALVLTVLIESIIAGFLGYRTKSEIIAIICVNLITNPVLNYLLLLNYHFSIIKAEELLVLFLELSVVLVEWRLLVYALQQKSWQLFLLSLVMNSCSYLIGVLIFR